VTPSEFTEEESNAFLAAAVPIIVRHIVRQKAVEAGMVEEIRGGFSVDMEPIFGHERELARRISVTTEMRDRLIARHDRAELLRLHYGEGMRHPDDGYLPIDKWDETA
jgi:hypothetical protein